MGMYRSTYARHIGRVGALAVALGIGAAIANAPAVAWAGPDDGGDGSSNTSDGNTGGTDNSGGGTDNTPGGTGSGSTSPGSNNSGGTTSPDPSPSTGTPSSTQRTKWLGGGVSISSSGGANNSDEVELDTPQSKSNTVVVRAEEDAEAPAVSQPVAAAVVEAPAVQASKAPEPAPPVAETAPTTFALKTTKALEPSDDALVPSEPVEPQPLTAESTDTLSAFSAAVSSLLGTGSGGPAEAPLAWVMLAAARRQVGDTDEISNFTAVAPANPVPTVTKNPPNASTGVVTGQITATNPNDDTLKYSVTSQPSKGTITIDPATGKWTYTPTPSARHAAAGVPENERFDSFNLTVSDGQGGTATRAVAVDIAPTNTAPTVKTEGVKVNMNNLTVGGTPTNSVLGYVTGRIVATDADGDAVKIKESVDQKTAKGTVTVNADGTFTYKVDLAQRYAAVTTPATDTFKVTVDDGHGALKTVDVTVTVVPPNPVVIKDYSTSTSSGQVKGTLTPNIAGAGPITLSADPTATQPLKGKVTVSSTGEFTYTPSEAARREAATVYGEGKPGLTDTFTVTFTDKYGAAYTQTVKVPIVAKSTAYATVSRGSNYAQNGEVLITFTAPGGDSKKLKVDPLGETPGGELKRVGETNTFTYTPTPAARAASAAAQGVSDAPLADTVRDVAFTVDWGTATPFKERVIANVTVLPSQKVGSFTPLGSTPKYELATFPSSRTEGNGQTDAAGNMYVPVGNKVLIYGPDNKLKDQALLLKKGWLGPKPLNVQLKDVAPVENGKYLYAVDYAADINPFDVTQPVVEHTDIKKLKLGADGNYTVDESWGGLASYKDYDGVMRKPQGFHIATDDAGYLYVAQGIYVREGQQVGSVIKYDTDGKYVTQFGRAPAGAASTWDNGTFNVLSGIAVTPDGKTVYVSENTNNRLQRFDTANDANTQYRQTLTWGNTRDTVKDTGLLAAYEVAVDRQGYVYVLTASDSQVTKYKVTATEVNAAGFVTKASQTEEAHIFMGNYDPNQRGSILTNRLSHGLVVSARGDVVSTQTGRIALIKPTNL